MTEFLGLDHQQEAVEGFSIAETSAFLLKNGVNPQVYCHWLALLIRPVAIIRLAFAGATFSFFNSPPPIKRFENKNAVLYVRNRGSIIYANPEYNWMHFIVLFFNGKDWEIRDSIDQAVDRSGFLRYASFIYITKKNKTVDTAGC